MNPHLTLRDAESDGDGPSLSRAEKRDLTIEQIMEAATRCFVRSGFQGASMHQICAEVGMSPGALYRYFPSKEAIIEAITEAHRRHDAEIFKRMFDNPDVVDGFVSAGIAHMRYVHASGFAPLLAEIRAESMRNPSVDQICRCAVADVEATFRDYLQQAIDRGDIAPCIDLDSLMPMIVAIGEGISTRDLPSQGVSFDKLETMFRVAVAAMLRPTRAEAGERA